VNFCLVTAGSFVYETSVCIIVSLFHSGSVWGNKKILPAVQTYTLPTLQN